ncbi:hypothetical protein ABXL43_22235 [Burkholderia sola]
MTTTTDLPDLDSPRNGTAFVVRPDRHVPSRRHDARADDMDATLDLPLHPHASSEANPSGYRMRVDVGYVTRYPNRCHTMPRISDAMRRASRRFVRLSIDAIRDAVTIWTPDRRCSRRPAPRPRCQRQRSSDDVPDARLQR